MDDVDAVRVGHGDAILTFHRAGQGLRTNPTVTLDASTLHASLPLDLDTYDGRTLSGFFDSLAASWRGWDGSREWFNIERDFRLQCHHNGIGGGFSCRDHGRSSPVRLARMDRDGDDRR